jgi:hypothetical protein
MIITLFSAPKCDELGENNNENVTICGIFRDQVRFQQVIVWGRPKLGASLRQTGTANDWAKAPSEGRLA